jgi:fructose-bisphosphate aldolase class I
VLVPVVEPELLMAGDHSAQGSEETTGRILGEVFSQMVDQGVLLEGMILKPNMAVPGSDARRQVPVAEMALRCLLRTVPAAVPGIAFLSGGQPPDLASARLNARHGPERHAVLPWEVSFSFGRAIQQPALALWKGHYSRMAAARLGRYEDTTARSAA